MIQLLIIFRQLIAIQDKISYSSSNNTVMRDRMVRQLLKVIRLSIIIRYRIVILLLIKIWDRIVTRLLTVIQDWIVTKLSIVFRQLIVTQDRISYSTSNSTLIQDRIVIQLLLV